MQQSAAEKDRGRTGIIIIFLIIDLITLYFNIALTHVNFSSSTKHFLLEFGTC